MFIMTKTMLLQVIVTVIVMDTVERLVVMNQ